MELMLKNGAWCCPHCGTTRLARTVMLPGWQNIEARTGVLKVVSIEQDAEGDAEIGDHLYCTACGQTLALPEGIGIEE